MEQESQDYADFGPRSRLPTPAELAGLVVIGFVAVLIVAAFIAMVVVLHGRKFAG